VTDALDSVLILLGTDFAVNNNVSVAPYKGGMWYIHVGPIDDPL